MKPTLFILVVMLISASGLLYSQTEKGSWEMSVAGTVGLTSSSTNGNEGESTSYVSLAFRPGYYFVDKISFEPEFYWTAIEDELPIFSISGNLSYTFTAGESSVYPFLFAGYGVGNGIPLFQRLVFRSSDKMDITVLNLGLGGKFFVSKSVALKVEYRYQRYNQSEDSTDHTVYFHNIFFGFSVFL